MLTPHELELLTAHVDGELNSAQRRQVAALLERSGEARTLLTQLQRDAERLRSLSRRTVPIDLSETVLAEIGQLACQPRVVPLRRTTKFPLWRGVAAAAAVLFAVGLGSFLLNSPKGDPTIANNTQASIDKQPESGNDRDTSPLPRKTLEPLGNPNRDKAIVKVEQLPTPRPVQTTPPPNQGDILAANGHDSATKLEKVEVDLPTIARLHELHQEEHASALTDRLSKLRSARVELTSREGAKAFERLRKALEAKQVTLHVDPLTQARLKKPQQKTDVVVFLENVKPETLVELLQQVGNEDRMGDPHFEGAVVVKELARWDRKDLMDLLGIDPLVNRPSPIRKQGVDIRREFPEQTAREVVAALDGKGVPRPGSEPRHHAFVSHFPATKNRSTELTRFLELRQPVKSGTLQVLLLVIRHVS